MREGNDGRSITATEEVPDMTDAGSLVQDTIYRVLEAAPRGLTVERIRTQLAEAGASVGKDEIVRALARMNERQLVQFGAARRRHP